MLAAERYYVRHHDAVHGTEPAYSVVRDRLYCCWDIAWFHVRDGSAPQRGDTIAKMQRRAEQRCAELNAAYHG